MNRVFVDTSGILALLVSTEKNHAKAKRVFAKLEAMDATLHTTSYVLLELYALIGRRFGLNALSRFRTEMAPLFTVAWVDDDLHEAGLDFLFHEKTRRLSLVDAVSFVFMRRQGMFGAFAFDSHFKKFGFQLLA